MFRYLVVFLLLAGAARAQQFQNIVPPPYAAQGVMTGLTQSSVTISSGTVTMTKGSFPSSVLPMMTTLRLKAQATNTGNLSVCWYGTSGGCTATNGELLAPGESRIIALPTFASSPPQVFCVAGTCSVELEF